MTVLPKFSKLDDDIATKDNWITFNGTPDFIIFDGWCVGAEAQSEKNWKSPIKFDTISQHIKRLHGK